MQPAGWAWWPPGGHLDGSNLDGNLRLKGMAARARNHDRKKGKCEALPRSFLARALRSCILRRHLGSSHPCSIANYPCARYSSPDAFDPSLCSCRGRTLGTGAQGPGPELAEAARTLSCEASCSPLARPLLAPLDVVATREHSREADILSGAGAAPLSADGVPAERPTSTVAIATAQPCDLVSSERPPHLLCTTPRSASTLRLLPIWMLSPASRRARMG
jgi:hypothetical protein